MTSLPARGGSFRKIESDLLLIRYSKWINLMLPKPLILIPCYNCGESVLDVIAGCRSFCDEIVLVNDGSTDQTPEYLAESGGEVIGWEFNRGKGAALIEGFRYGLEKKEWDVLITMDSDGQHDPHDLPLFLKRYQERKEDLVIGRRDFTQSQVPNVRRYANDLSSWVIAKIFGIDLGDIQCGYRLHSREGLQQVFPYLTSHGFAMETEIVLLMKRMGFSLGEVDIRCLYSSDSQRRSSWKPFYDSWHIFKVCWKAYWQRKV